MMEKSNVGSVPSDWTGMWWLLPAILAAVAVLTWMSQPRGEAPNLVGWIGSFDAAAGLSKQTGKPVLIDFTQDNCAPCRNMDFNVFGSTQVASVIRADFVPLRIDITPGKYERFELDLTQRYEISGTPTLLITDSDGKVIARVDHSLGKGDMLAWLDSIKAAPPARPRAQ